MGTKCPEWPGDFEEYGGEAAEAVDYRVMIQMVWEELITGDKNPVVATSGNLVFIGHLEDVGGGVEMSIDIGQLNFRWSSLADMVPELEEDFNPRQEGIPFKI